jgi:hypothetical protein
MADLQELEVGGFKPEWKVDHAKAHHRELSFQQVKDHEITTSWSSESVGDAPASRDLSAASPRR